MDELFSCRNCIHNSAQTLNIGRGAGFCLQHNSVIRNPVLTTCKYLYRKDLPWFLVDEGRSEHAAEFARYPGMVNLHSRQSLPNIFYSEQFAWESKTFDALTNAVAQYHKSRPSWVFIESMTAGVDGRRAITHASLARRYMNHCNTWKSSYRLVLAVASEMSEKPIFKSDEIVKDDSWNGVESDAIWDVVFLRIALLQEYGWHSGLEYLQWFTDSLGDEISAFDWEALQPVLGIAVRQASDLIVEHAKSEGVYFAQGLDTRDDEYVA